jgi:rhodanese-related sulfurtransferase
MDHSPRFLKLVEEARERIEEVSIEQVRGRLARGDRFALVDVREDHEWAKGHLPGARHLGRGILERDVERLYPDLEAELVLYCGGGFRSALSADSLRTMGYRNVFSMAGGFRGWVAAGAPIEGASAPTKGAS